MVPLLRAALLRRAVAGSGLDAGDQLRRWRRPPPGWRLSAAPPLGGRQLLADARRGDLLGARRAVVGACRFPPSAAYYLCFFAFGALIQGAEERVWLGRSRRAPAPRRWRSRRWCLSSCFGRGRSGPGPALFGYPGGLGCGWPRLGRRLGSRVRRVWSWTALSSPPSGPSSATRPTPRYWIYPRALAAGRAAGGADGSAPAALPRGVGSVVVVVLFAVLVGLYELGGSPQRPGAGARTGRGRRAAGGCGPLLARLRGARSAGSLRLRWLRRRPQAHGCPTRPV